MRVQISEELGKKISELAQKIDCSTDFYVEQALKQLLEDKEDLEFALSRRHQTGPNISLDDLENELNISHDDKPVDR